MGPPTQDDSTNPTDPTLTWQAFDYQFIAFLGLDGKAMTLDANDIMLTPSEKSQITCPEVRRAS